MLQAPGEPKGQGSSLPKQLGATEIAPGVLPTPRLTRTEIAEGPHVTLRGTVDSACAGAVRVDLVPAEPGHPIAVWQLPDGEMDFEVLAPEGEDVVITAICDIDRDGRLSPDDWLAELLPIGPANADRDELMLHWMPNMDAGSLAMGKPDVLPEQPKTPQGPVSDPPPQ